MHYYYFLGLQISLDDIVAMIISSVAVIIALIACYYLYRASKVMAGGALEKAFSRIAVSVILMIYTVAFLVVSFGPFNLTEDLWVAFIGPSLWLIGNVFLLFGCREIAKLTKKE